MTRRAKSVAFTVIAFIAGLLLSAWLLVRPSEGNQFGFLSGRSPTSIGYLRTGFGPKEIRVYTWKEPRDQVLAQARAELTRLGMTERPMSKRQPVRTFLGKITYSSSLEGIDANLGVSVQAGRHHELNMHEGLADNDPEWVTVVVKRDIDESWPNVIRYTFFSVPD